MIVRGLFMYGARRLGRCLGIHGNPGSVSSGPKNRRAKARFSEARGERDHDPHRGRHAGRAVSFQPARPCDRRPPASSTTAVITSFRYVCGASAAGKSWKRTSVRYWSGPGGKSAFTLATASTVNFFLGADDDAFFYVDNTLVNSIGGIHGDTPAPLTTTSLAQGTHTIELFYDDRQPSAAALDFNLQSITVVPSVPEPSTFALLGIGLAGLGFLRRRARGG